MQDEVTVTQAEELFDAIYSDMASYAEWGIPSYREASLQTINEAFARHRHQAERETLARMEPVAWMYCTPHGFCDFHEKRPANPSALTDAGWIETPLCALPPARMEWRPIETAPKDGTRFWGFWPVDDEVGQQQVTYFDQFTLPFPRFCDLADHIDWTQPTAWQPLPPAPEAGQ